MELRNLFANIMRQIHRAKERRNIAKISSSIWKGTKNKWFIGGSAACITRLGQFKADLNGVRLIPQDLS
eukprot:6213906-Pleurochrysis_carterae.AAC.4